MIASETSDLDPAAFDRLKRLGGVRLLGEMIDLFLEHAPPRMEAALAAGHRGDLGAVNQAVHSLKSSAANLGARVVRDLAEQLEQISAGAAQGDLPALLNDLRTAFSRVQARLVEERRGLVE